MKVEVEIWEKVYERSTAVVDIPDNELGDEYENPEYDAEEWLINNMDRWYDTAYITHDEVLGPDGDSEVVVTILEEKK